jgi:hypothetical protein
MGVRTMSIPEKIVVALVVIWFASAVVFAVVSS